MGSTAYASDAALRVSREDDRTVVWLTGDHDIATQKNLADVLVNAIAVDHADLVVDLGAVTFLSAATINELVRARAFLHDHSRDLALRAPSPAACRILEICGLMTLVECRP